MDDKNIVQLYWDRSEQAIVETDSKYGAYCYSIAYNALANNEDAEESVSDTYMAAWKSIPPRRPRFLSAFLGKLTRHISIDRWRRSSAKKRGGGELSLVMDELEEVIADSGNVEAEYERKELAGIINGYLHSLPDRECNIFLRRYFYMESVKEIAKRYALSESNVSMTLSRTRKKLKVFLEKKEYVI